MIDQEKELADFLKDIYYNAPYVGDEFMETAKRIIAKYPQILAEKVWEGENEFGEFWHMNIPPIYCPKGKYQVFIREVK